MPDDALFEMPMEGKTELVRQYIQGQIDRAFNLAMKYPSKSEKYERQMAQGKRALDYFDDIERAAIRGEHAS